MKIIRVDEDGFRKWRKQIEDLIVYSAKINFPGCEIDENYGITKCNTLEKYIAEDSAAVFAAIEDDLLLGWIWIHEIDRMGKKRVHVSEIAVSDKYRHRGLGKSLLETAEAYAADHGYKEIDLLVTASNEAAVGFYRDADFITERYLMKKVIN